jgi:hypothetical protein
VGLLTRLLGSPGEDFTNPEAWDRWEARFLRRWERMTAEQQAATLFSFSMTAKDIQDTQRRDYIKSQIVEAAMASDAARSVIDELGLTREQLVNLESALGGSLVRPSRRLAALCDPDSLRLYFSQEHPRRKKGETKEGALIAIVVKYRY